MTVDPTIRYSTVKSLTDCSDDKQLRVGSGAELSCFFDQTGAEVRQNRTTKTPSKVRMSGGESEKQSSHPDCDSRYHYQTGSEVISGQKDNGGGSGVE